MKILTSYILVFTSCFFSGCKKDEKLKFQPGGKTVLIEAQLPTDLEVLPIGVMYRSSICHKKRVDGSGKFHEEPGYHFIEKKLKKEEGNFKFSSLVPSEGGGRCDWKIINIMVKFKYKSSGFEGSFDKVLGSNVIVIFDDNHPQIDDGIYEYVTGDLYISMNYFPWINERFLNGHTKNLWTYGKKLYINYKTKDTYKVVFSPVSHSKLITHSTGPKVKKPGGGNYTRYIYPDGSVVENGGPFPDFKKLKIIADKITKQPG